MRSLRYGQEDFGHVLGNEFSDEIRYQILFATNAARFVNSTAAEYSSELGLNPQLFSLRANAKKLRASKLHCVSKHWRNATLHSLLQAVRQWVTQN